MIGCLTYGCTMILIGSATELWFFYLGAFTFGIAAGLGSPTIFAWTVDLADQKHIGRAMATMFIALEAGIILGGVFAGYSYNNNPDNFVISFNISGILAFAATLYLAGYLFRMKKASA
jgi:MFS family permease